MIWIPIWILTLAMAGMYVLWRETPSNIKRYPWWHAPPAPLPNWRRLELWRERQQAPTVKALTRRRQRFELC